MLLKAGRRGDGIYRAAYYAPSIVGGSVAIAVMWRQVFGTQGIINAISALFGIPAVTFLGDPRGTGMARSVSLQKVNVATWVYLETKIVVRSCGVPEEQDGPG